MTSIPINVSDPIHGMREATDELADAVEDLGIAQRAAAEANRRQSECMTRVNNAQKTFDAAVTKVRASAPTNTDWAVQTTRELGFQVFNIPSDGSLKYADNPDISALTRRNLGLK